MDSVLADLGRLSLEGRKQEFLPIQVKKDLSIVKDLILRSPRSGEWVSVDCNAIVNYFALDSQSLEHKILEDNFRKWSSYSCHRVIKIIKVLNPFLYVQYQLKLKQKFELYYRELYQPSLQLYQPSLQLYGSASATDCQLYHGTKSCNLDSICRRNFDWRQLGANGLRSSKFGRGVSFSPSSKYASDYPRRYTENPRTMIVARVIVGLRCDGYSDMVIPPLPADTSVKPGDGHVVVKYFDNEFYPEYIIYYT